MPSFCFGRSQSMEHHFRREKNLRALEKLLSDMFPFSSPKAIRENAKLAEHHSYSSSSTKEEYVSKINQQLCTLEFFSKVNQQKTRSLATIGSSTMNLASETQNQATSDSRVKISTIEELVRQPKSLKRQRIEALFNHKNQTMDPTTIQLNYPAENLNLPGQSEHEQKSLHEISASPLNEGYNTSPEASLFNTNEGQTDWFNTLQNMTNLIEELTDEDFIIPVHCSESDVDHTNDPSALYELIEEDSDPDELKEVISIEIDDESETEIDYKSENFNWDVLVEVRGGMDVNYTGGFEIDDAHEDLSLPVSLWDF